MNTKIEYASKTNFPAEDKAQNLHIIVVDPTFGLDFLITSILS